MPSASKLKAGGGIKKVLATLKVARDSGWRPTTKALTSNNTCKACGLGMGGQAGGMTNELGEFPSVCNKSVQAQSSDLQAPIPEAVFRHTIEELGELTEREMNSLGRLNTPLQKVGDRLQPIDWPSALARAVAWFGDADPERSFFYSSGRSSNEAGFILQLFARLYGTNNVNNCSYYCHQATSEALQSSVGTGTATIELSDLKGADCIFVVGANPASNHPRFIHQLEACRARGGEVIVINPAREPGLVRFAIPKQAGSLIAGGSEIASAYLQPRIGSDVFLFQGLAKAVLEARKEDRDFISTYSRGYAAYVDQLQTLSWEIIEAQTGLERSEMIAVAERYSQARNAVFAWGMGLTHHLHGVENIEQLANLAMLRGMLGRRYAGLLPLRGHSNVQGIGTIGVKPVLGSEVLEGLEATLGVALPRSDGMDTMAAMQAAHRGEIELALCLGGNLFAANPGTEWAREALGRIDRKIYLTTTLNRGHVNGLEGEVIIFPVAARDEEAQPTTQESMFNFVRLSDGGITRLDNVRPESDVLINIAAEVVPTQTFDFRQFASHNSVREAIAKTIPGMSELVDIGVAKREFHVRHRLLHSPSFATEDGKCHFRVCSPTAEKPDIDLYGFTLATVRSEGQFNTIVYEEEDTYRQVPSRWSVLMNLQDMEALGLQAGDTVDLQSPHGRMRAVSVRPFDLPRGNVMAYFPEANCLVDTAVDPRSRTPAFKSTPVAVVRGDREAGVPLRTGETPISRTY